MVKYHYFILSYLIIFAFSLIFFRIFLFNHLSLHELFTILSKCTIFFIHFIIIWLLVIILIFYIIFVAISSIYIELRLRHTIVIFLIYVVMRCRFIFLFRFLYYFRLLRNPLVIAKIFIILLNINCQLVKNRCFLIISIRV